MKIRNGFVSNSSSSSFIVAARDVVCDCCGISRYEIINSLHSGDSYISGGPIDTEEDLKESLLDLWSYEILRTPRDEYISNYITEHSFVRDPYYYGRKFTPDQAKEIAEEGYDELKERFNEDFDKCCEYLKQGMSIFMGRIEYKDQYIFSKEDDNFKKIYFVEA